MQADIDYRGLELRNVDGSLMAFVCHAMPKVMRETLYESLKASFGNDDIFESRLPFSVEERDERFYAVHFSLWNRYGVSVQCLSLLPGTLMKLTGSYRATQLLKMSILTSLVLLIPVPRVHANSTSLRLYRIFL